MDFINFNTADAMRLQRVTVREKRETGQEYEAKQKQTSKTKRSSAAPHLLREPLFLPHIHIHILSHSLG
jgi:hypothetical protein